MSRVTVGSQWKPGYALVQNTETGFFSERNPPLTSQAELQVQRALLAPAPKKVQERIKAIQQVRGENWPGWYGPDYRQAEEVEHQQQQEQQ